MKKSEKSVIMAENRGRENARQALYRARSIRAGNGPSRREQRRLQWADDRRLARGARAMAERRIPLNEIQEPVHPPAPTAAKRVKRGS